MVQLKYHDAGAEKECMPRFGAWNMRDKVHPHILSLHAPPPPPPLTLSLISALNGLDAEIGEWRKSELLVLYLLLTYSWRQ